MKKYFIGAGAIITLSILYVLIFLPYNKDLKKNIKRLHEKKSDTIDTYVGQIEYKTKGKGIPVLVSHGIMGGYDQGILMGEYLFGSDFKIISVSRFGYLGTSTPINPSPTTQATAYKEVLDSLNVNQVIVLGFSTGGPSALKFAQDFPERTRALIVSNTPYPGKGQLKEGLDLSNLLLQDFIFWLGMKYRKDVLSQKILGINELCYNKFSRKEKRMTDSLISTMLPIGYRKKGVSTDKKVMKRVVEKNYGNFQVNQILVPTLLFYSKNSSLVSHSKSKELATDIYTSQLYAFSRGGNFNIGHIQEMRKKIHQFLSKKFDW